MTITVTKEYGEIKEGGLYLPSFFNAFYMLLRDKLEQRLIDSVPDTVTLRSADGSTHVSVTVADVISEEEMRELELYIRGENMISLYAELSELREQLKETSPEIFEAIMGDDPKKIADAAEKIMVLLNLKRSEPLPASWALDAIVSLIRYEEIELTETTDILEGYRKQLDEPEREKNPIETTPVPPKP